MEGSLFKLGALFHQTKKLKSMMSPLCLTLPCWVGCKG